MSRPGAGGLRFGMFAVCVARDSEPELNKGKAKPLYDVLVSYADVGSRDTGQGYPYREALAAHLDCSPQTVDRATKYLEQEIGLVRVVRRKVEGKESENDANLYLMFDAWLIHGMPAPADTPPQLVARYGHTIPGFDVDAWMEECAPDFDLSGWRAAHAERMGQQQSEQEERRHKDRARKRKAAKKKGGDVTGDVTPVAQESEGGHVTGDGTRHVTHDVTGDVMGGGLSRTSTQDPSSRELAPPARSAGDVRRTTTGSSACEGDSGCAATEEPPPAADGAGESTARPSAGSVPAQRGGGGKGSPFAPELRQRVYATEALLPSPLRALFTEKFPYGHLPNVNRQVTVQALESRSPEQLGERATSRWRSYGYDLAHEDGEIRSPLGVMEELLRPTPYCPDIACEDGRNIHTGEQCTPCAERIEQRRRDRAAGRPVARHRPTRLYRDREECDVCARPLAADAAAGDVCSGCQAEIDRSIALHTGTPVEAPVQPEGQDDPNAPAGPGAEYRRWREQKAAAQGSYSAAVVRARADKAARAKEARNR
ncbi:hypothetical protein [Streptomyces sp. NPDC047070]|uniref:hypothetical protein n=1 Tax=Streptomyces sp. NPDC047070 TaxID=3154923 RepID=UPI003453BDB7